MNARLPQPPITTRRWTRMMLAFGVSVALGMAPLLGHVGIPGFTSLLALFPVYPFDFTTQLVAVTGLLMGLSALLIQYFQHDQISKAKRNRWFIVIALGLAVCLFLMFAMYLFSVEQVGDYNVLIGYKEPGCTLCSGMTRSECLARITLETRDIDRCFGSSAVRTAALVLAFLYMSALSMLGVLVGLLMLKEPR